MVQPGFMSRWTNQKPKHTSIPLGKDLPLRDGIGYHTKKIKLTNTHIVAAVGNDIRVYSLQECRLVHTLAGFRRLVAALDVFQESKTGSETLVAASWDNTIRIWDLESGECLHWAPLGGHVLVDGSFSLFILEPELVEVEGKGTSGGDRWPTEALFVTWKVRSSAFKVFELLHVEGRGPGVTGALKSFSIRSIQTHGHPIYCLDAKGTRAVTGSIDCTVRIWNIVTGECEWCFIAHRDTVRSVRISNMKACSMTLDGTRDGTLRVWDLQTGECTHALKSHGAGDFSRVSISPNFLVYSLKDGSLGVWDVFQNEEKHRLLCLLDKMDVWYHDDFKIAAVSHGSLQVLDVSSGKSISQLLPSDSDTMVYWTCSRGRFCAAVVLRGDEQYLEVWEFAGEDT